MAQITFRRFAASQQFIASFSAARYTPVSKGKNLRPDESGTRREADFLQFSGRFFDIATRGRPTGRARAAELRHARSRGIADDPALCAYLNGA
ncbi:hypothetical protein [Burkholderia sp.]|uniref:hypothetical protein n=1 Tax=Burkholderia sp. TaxID=36773 RepID=UPI0025C58BC9|nr:hypothetical protein [Burkholderia sp.]MBS6360100.1 hypothetical protein [Burkholderia sp.]